MLKSYEIVYIFVTPSPPLTRRYLISENVDNSGRPLRALVFFSVKKIWGILLEGYFSGIIVPFHFLSSQIYLLRKIHIYLA